MLNMPSEKEVNGLTALFNQGRFIEAEIVASQLTKRFPRHGFSWKVLGVLLKLRGEAVAALEPMQKAALLLPHDAGVLSNLGATLTALGRHGEAEASYRRAILLKPGFAEAHNNLGNVLRRQGRMEEAEACYRRALDLAPGFAEAESNLGNTLNDQGRLKEAEACYRRAIALKGDIAAVHNNLGNVLKDQGRLEESEASYRLALQLAPAFAEAQSNLGNVLRRQGRLEEAEAWCRRALEQEPKSPQAQSNLGNVFKDQGRLAEAEACYRLALEADCRLAEAHNNLGITLDSQGRFQEAEACYRTSLALKPECAETHSNLGNTLRNRGLLREAEGCYRRALELNPEFAEAHGNLGDILKDQGRLQEAETCYRQALALDPQRADVHSNLLFCLLHNEQLTPEECRDEHFAFSRQFEEQLRPHWLPHRNDPDPDRRLKVGFVSGDLRSHVVANYIEPVWKALSRSATTELWVYSNFAGEDAVSRQLRQDVHHWRMVVGLTDEALATVIRSDAIDILIDLSGHTGHNRLLTFARKPAPLQATWIGYPGTTGLAAIDYLICDRFNAPFGSYERYYSEKFARLPSTGAFMPSADAPTVNELPALSNGFVTFASFSRPNKLGKSVIDIWSEVLRALPAARLLLSPIDDRGLVEELTACFSRNGIASDRLDFRPKLPLPAYLALHHEVDIILDTWPYSGGTTSNHAAWMGVPVVTMRGPSRAHCLSASTMCRMGLDDWVADDTAGFVNIAVAQARNLGGLAVLRRGMRDRWLHSPLRQGDIVARGLEAALRFMWQRWCNGRPADHFEVRLADIL